MSTCRQLQIWDKHQAPTGIGLEWTIDSSMGGFEVQNIRGHEGSKHHCLFEGRRKCSIAGDRLWRHPDPSTQHCTGWQSATHICSVLYLEYHHSWNTVDIWGRQSSTLTPLSPSNLPMDFGAHPNSVTGYEKRDHMLPTNQVGSLGLLWPWNGDRLNNSQKKIAFCVIWSLSSYPTIIQNILRGGWILNMLHTWLCAGLDPIPQV